MTNSDNIAVSVDSVSKSFPSGDTTLQVLKQVSLEIPRSQLLCIRGPSGSGKTTLLSVLAGLEKPDAGHVYIRDQDVTKLSPTESAAFRRQSIGMIFQFFNLIPNLSIEQNIALPLLLEGERMRKVRPAVLELASRLGIEARLNARPATLSGGEMQRAAIARALIASPDVVLADEPTGNLDADRSEEIYALLRSLTRERNATILMVTHDLEAISYADRVVELKSGTVRTDSQRTEA